MQTSSIAYFHEGENRLKRELELLDRDIKEPNRTYLLKFKDYLELNNRKQLTIAHRLKELRFSIGLLHKDAKKLLETT